MFTLSGQLRSHSVRLQDNAAKVSGFTAKSEEAKLTALICAANFWT